MKILKKQLSTTALAAFTIAASLTLPGRAQSVDLVAVGLEVTQGIQDLNNSVRLVSQKRTFVRFYVRTSQGAANTTAVLTARRGDSSVTLAPLNDGAEIQVVAKPTRLVLDQAFLFHFPDGYRHVYLSPRAQL